MPNLQQDGNRYWFVYRQGAGALGMQQLGGVTIASPDAKTFTVFGGTFTGPTRAIWGYANGTNPALSSWRFTPQGGWIATENGGVAFDFTWTGTGLTQGQALPYDWPNSGIVPTERGTGDPVNWDGTVGEPPPTETIDNHKIGFTLTNNSDAPKDYYIQPTDMNGTPLPDMDFEKVTLAPGESRPFAFSRPGTGTGGTGGAFKVTVIQTDWVADPEFGVSKQESLTGTWNSVPHVVPINNASPTPSQQSSGPGTTSTQAPAQQTQVSGESAITASQANALNQNVLNELQRLGATVQSSASVAHSDAQQMLGKLGGIGTGETDMSGVEGKLDGLQDTLDGLTGEALGPPTQVGPGQASPSGIADAEGDTSMLQGLMDKYIVITGRVQTLAAQLMSVADAIPAGGGSQNLDFSFSTSLFGTVNFHFSAYAEWIGLIRAGVLLVMAFYTFFASIKLVRFAFV